MGRLEELDRVVGLGPLYDATGTQAMAFNTIGQLLAERGSTAYGAASHLLMVPDLLAYLLTGQRRLERTIASTTQLVDARTGGFVEWLFPRLGLRRDIFGAAIEPGEPYSEVLPAVAASVGMTPPPSVVAVASHDTASAVLAVPAVTDDFAYVSSGTWSLVGLEFAAPVISEASRKANFSNELGYGGTVRFLKNVMGYWMLQEAERCWARQGRDSATSLSFSVRPSVRAVPFAGGHDRPRVRRTGRYAGTCAGGLCRQWRTGARERRRIRALRARQHGSRRLFGARRGAELHGQARQRSSCRWRRFGQPALPLPAGGGQ